MALGKSLLLTVVVVLMTGCTSMQALEPSPVQAASQLQPGQRAIVYLKNGRALDMRVVSISDQTFTGLFGEQQRSLR